ncbi:MAG: MFS transporter, partial [Rhodococcus sp.]|nr:MFS transporter [Rhodococcus sp. (in: high G+C Gram-positive bacteria)]
VGFAGLAAVMITLLAGLSLATSSGFTSGTAALTLGAGVLLLVLWTLWELRTPSPAIDVRLILSRRAGPIHIAGFLFGLVIFGSQAPLTTFLSADPDSTGYGFSASSASISLVVAALGLFATVGAAAFAGIARYTGMRGVLLLGALLALGANVMIAALHTQMWQVWLYTVIAGFGMGLLLGGLPALLAEVTPHEQTGSSVGVYNSLRSLGGAAGGALFAVVLSAATIGSRDTAELSGYVLMWVLCAIAFLAAAIALTFLPVRRLVPSADGDAPVSL